MDEDGPTSQDANPSDAGDDITVDAVPAAPAEQTAPPTVTPWWSGGARSTAATTDVPPSDAPGAPAPPVAPLTASPTRRRSGPVLLGALVGALVASLVTGLLFVAFRDDTKSSTDTTTPLAITGANTRGTVPLPPAGSSGIDVSAVLARIQPAVVRIKISTADGAAAGTGIVIDPNGTIVTNAHVVEGADTIQVQLPNGDILPAKTKGVDPSDDLAVVTIAGHNLPSAVLGDSDALTVGDPVIAVGNALDLGISVTSGIVSAIDRDVPEENGNTLYGALQTDAAINPGNSGGPLVNARGEVIGINTAIAPPTDANNVGFAIAISAAKPIIGDLAEGRTPHDALLGVVGLDVTPQLAKQHHLHVTSGVYVDQVDGGSAAARAGIVKGDTVLSFDGRPVTTIEQMRRYVRRNQPGDKVSIVYVKPDGSRHTTTVVLGAN